MTAPIEVLAIRRTDGIGTIKAFCDVRLGGVTLKGCKIVQQDGQKPWLATPSVKTERGWQNVVELSKPLRERATEVVLAAWEARRAQDEPPARQAERGGQTVEALEERAEAWSKRQRDEHVEELARRFDERGPDEVPF